MLCLEDNALTEDIFRNYFQILLLFGLLFGAVTERGKSNFSLLCKGTLSISAAI